MQNILREKKRLSCSEAEDMAQVMAAGKWCHGGGIRKEEIGEREEGNGPP